MKHQRSVVALGKTAGIGLIAKAYEVYSVLFNELHFLLGTFNERSVGKKCGKPGSGARENLLYVGCILKQEFGTTCLVYELP